MTALLLSSGIIIKSYHLLIMSCSLYLCINAYPVINITLILGFQLSETWNYIFCWPISAWWTLEKIMDILKERPLWSEKAPFLFRMSPVQTGAAQRWPVPTGQLPLRGLGGNSSRNSILQSCYPSYICAYVYRYHDIYLTKYLPHPLYLYIYVSISLSLYISSGFKAECGNLV
jgi:hypothetical protein